VVPLVGLHKRAIFLSLIKFAIFLASELGMSINFIKKFKIAFSTMSITYLLVLLISIRLPKKIANFIKKKKIARLVH